LSHTEPHDEFLELCAVSTSGQLTQEEQKRLQEHLAVCSSCREAITQYEALTAHGIPAIVADEVPEDLDPGPSWSQQRAEAALFNQIAQGENPEKADREKTQGDISNVVRQSLPFAGEATWRHVWTLYAAGVLLAVALGVCLYQVGMHHGADTARLVPLPVTTQAETSLEAEVSDAAHEREIALIQVAQRDRETADLRRRLERQSVELSQMKAAQGRLASDLRDKDAGTQDLVQREAGLKQKFDAAQANAQTLQQTLDVVSKQS
jgi:hypothetical protein